MTESEEAMPPAHGPEHDLSTLRAYAGRPVALELKDGSQHAGMLRTELLGERSISVFLAGAGGEGATIYLDDIVKVWPTS